MLIYKSYANQRITNLRMKICDLLIDTHSLIRIIVSLIDNIIITYYLIHNKL